jgi:thioredoxin reductase
MKEVVIIGGGVAGVSLIEKIREGDSKFKITLIDKKPYYFNRRDVICNIDSKDWFFFEEWAQDKRVDFFQKRVDKINLSRRKINFKEGGGLEFANLVVATGLLSSKIGVKGSHLKGFFYLSDIDLLEFREHLKVSAEVVVYVSTLLGLRLSIILKSLGKDVRVIMDDFGYLQHYRDEVIGFFNERKILVYENACIDEVIGEGTLKAVRISPSNNNLSKGESDKKSSLNSLQGLSFKILSSQMVIVDSGFVPNLNFFEEEVKSKGVFFTEFEGLYLLGDVSKPGIKEEFSFLSNHKEAIEEAAILANFFLTGEEPFYERKGCKDKESYSSIESILKEARAIRGG